MKGEARKENSMDPGACAGPGESSAACREQKKRQSSSHPACHIGKDRDGPAS